VIYFRKEGRALGEVTKVTSFFSGLAEPPTCTRSCIERRASSGFEH
jgi:hypothetical protein